MIRRAAQYVAKEIVDSCEYPLHEFIPFLTQEFPCPGDKEFNMDAMCAIFGGLKDKYRRWKVAPSKPRKCDCLAYKILYSLLFGGYYEGILRRHKEFRYLELADKTRALFTCMKIMYFKKIITAWGITNTPHKIDIDWLHGGTSVEYIQRGPVNLIHPYAEYLTSVMGPDALQLLRKHTNWFTRTYEVPRGVFLGEPEHVPAIKWILEAINFDMEAEVLDISQIRPRHIMGYYPSHNPSAWYLERRDIVDKKIQSTEWKCPVRVIDGTAQLLWKYQCGSGMTAVLVLPRHMLYEGEDIHYAITLMENPSLPPPEGHQREFGMWFHQQANSE